MEPYNYIILVHSYDPQKDSVIAFQGVILAHDLLDSYRRLLDIADKSLLDRTEFYSKRFLEGTTPISSLVKAYTLVFDDISNHLDDVDAAVSNATDNNIKYNKSFSESLDARSSLPGKMHAIDIINILTDDTTL